MAGRKYFDHGWIPSTLKNETMTEIDSIELSGNDGKKRLYHIYERMQRGLIYPSPYAIFATFWLTDVSRLRRPTLSALAKAVSSHIQQHYPVANTSAIVGINPNLWISISEKEGLSIPLGLTFSEPKKTEKGRITSTVFGRSNGSWSDNQGDLWFHIKSDEETNCQNVLSFIQRWLQETLPFKDVFTQHGSSRTQEQNKKKGKVLGRRFSENINNPTDPITVANQCLVGYEDSAHIGASYVLSQNFVIDWKALHTLSDTAIENVVGRKNDDTIIPSRDVRTHIKSARGRDENGNTIQILRLGLPFGHSKLPSVDALSRTGSNLGDEAGIYFAGFARSFPRIEKVMDGMLGHFPPFMTDRMFDHIKSNMGGFFYIPSNLDLGVETVDLKPLVESKWEEFPGIDWSRLDRHFERRSESKYLFYNSHDYIYRMATCKDPEIQPPSFRVLHLLSNMFSRWRDNWYFDRKQEEMNSLAYYLEKWFDKKTRDAVMASSVVIRKGWANRMTLLLYASDEYGFRGERLDTTTQKRINGADTFRINPYEIIVGGMENLSLSQGRYVIEYLNEEERLSSFLKTVSEASGVGHVVPDFEYVMKVGLEQAISDAGAKSKKEKDSAKKEFYQSVEQSLLGVQEWSIAYADLAARMASTKTGGEAAEQRNLTAIAARMKKLAKSPPSSFVEATQMLFTLHCALHLTGEPTAIGRFDQILKSYYSKDIAEKKLTPEEAQEIVDCFFIKIGEKVQQNRLNIEDHQPYGNLAMGGSSGPYPKGGSTNQWIHQLTVGGTIANDEETATSEYNDITMFALRASRRLPLNAPCVSLRVTKDIPDIFLKEAAKTILSGGAHPILINDEKVIEGLRACGDDVGGKSRQADSVSKQAGGAWNSRVSLRSARNYACDGCYEPQYPGENWFALNGFSSLQPLECAINMGKTYSLAGPSWYRGQLISFMSKPPEQIETFDELLELYFKHFYLLYAKQVDGQLNGYGALANFCPSPLLSAFMPSCLERGRDLYDGGARYNVYAPCFTGLASTISSLYAIKKMVYERDTAVTSLAELVDCLICDWGNKMIEPIISDLAGPVRTRELSERFADLRKVALSLPKFGTGHAEIDKFGSAFIERAAKVSLKVFRDPVKQTRGKMLDLAKKFGTPTEPFGIQIQPGVGTFASFVENGLGSGASADGRRSGETLPSDLSPSPSPGDQPPSVKTLNIGDVLKGYSSSEIDSMWNFAPTDLNIGEDFAENDLYDVLKRYAAGEGSNLLTITCASRDTLINGATQPEQYDLVRNRMGGWTEFYISMFPDKQRQHQRRPIMVYK